MCLDFERASIPEKDKALFRFLRQVNHAPATVRAEDVRRAQAAGWSDEALYDAITVCGIFNFFNRWIDGTGVPDVPQGFYEARLEAEGDLGYAL